MAKTNPSNAFKTKSTPQQPSAQERSGVFKDQPVTSDIKVEPPFTDYQKINHHPYLVDHFKLGDTWKDKLGGFEKEVSHIEGYFQEQVNQGKMKNDIDSVKKRIKKIYKLCNIDKTERTTMQIEKLAAYVKFLKETDDIEFKNWKYR